MLGIALGVAVAVSIDLANGSARRAFTLATEAVTGSATHQVIGGPSGLSDDVYRRLRLDLGVRRAAPVVDGDVAASDHRGRTFHVLGIDPFVDGGYTLFFHSGSANLFHFGGGANFWATRHLGARVELRDQVASYDGTIHYWGFRLGVAFR